MSIEIASLTDLDAAEVAANLAEVTQRIQEAHPMLDIKRGVVHDIVALVGAELGTQQQVELARYLSARSLRQIELDPTLADVDVVSDLLSNWGVDRKFGSAARGRVTIIVTSAVSLTIGSGAIFTADGKQFTSDQAYTAKPEPEQISGPSDRLLVKLDDGTWSFDINVTAVEDGPDSLISKDTLVLPVAQPTGYLTSYAAADFVGGLASETNTELLERLRQGVAAVGAGNRTTMAAALRAVDAYSRTVSSIIGMGDEEMLRDQHTIWPGSIGGRVDWYVRTAERAIRTTLRLQAAMTAVDAAGLGTWVVSIDRDTAPGFYEVTSIRPVGEPDAGGSLEILSDVRSFDLSETGEMLPDIETIQESAYTRYQTAVLTFTDDAAGDAVGAVRDYDVTVYGIPQIADIQDRMSSFDYRQALADVLVRAPIPCFVSVSFDLHKPHTVADPDLAAIREAVAAEVNGTPFVGRLYASRIQDVIHGFIPDGVSVTAVDLFGRLRWPDGTTHYVRSSEVLEIEAIDGSMVSPRTVTFYTNEDDVTIGVMTSVPVPT